MLGAQSVLRSTDTSAETMTPLAESSIHDRLVHSRCYSRLSSGPVNWAATLLENLSLAPFTPGKRLRRVLDALVHRPVERQNPHPGISGICLTVASWQEICRDSISHSL